MSYYDLSAHIALPSAAMRSAVTAQEASLPSQPTAPAVRVNPAARPAPVGGAQPAVQVNPAARPAPGTVAPPAAKVFPRAQGGYGGPRPAGRGGI